KIAKILPSLQLQSTLDPASPGAKPSLGDILGTMPVALDPHKSEAVAQVVAQLSISDPKFSSALTEAGLSKDEATAVQRTLKLGSLTLGHIPLLNQLQEIVKQDNDTSLRSLAIIPADQWFDMAYAHGSPTTSNLNEDAYARQLQTSVQSLHPS